MDRSRYQVLLNQIATVAALKLSYDDGDLRIHGLSRGEEIVVELHFIDVLLLRIAPEGVRLKLQKELGEAHGLVLTDEQSKLIAWVFDEGMQTRDMSDAKHFLVLIGEEIVDVVSLAEPEITVLQKQ